MIPFLVPHSTKTSQFSSKGALSTETRSSCGFRPESSAPIHVSHVFKEAHCNEAEKHTSNSWPPRVEMLV